MGKKKGGVQPYPISIQNDVVNFIYNKEIKQKKEYVPKIKRNENREFNEFKQVIPQIYKDKCVTSSASFSNGDYYEGQFINGIINGVGTYFFCKR